MPGDWEKDWEMILGGGPPLWKDGEKYANYKMAYDMLVEQGAVDPAKPLRIFVPLAGDGAICPYFYHKGNSMVAAEVSVVLLAINQRGTNVLARLESRAFPEWPLQASVSHISAFDFLLS
jgi:hypothetical protein